MTTATTTPRPAATPNPRGESALGPAARPGRPDKPLVVYDGACPFCRKHVANFKSRDTQDTFEYTPRQAEGLDERFPQLLEGDFNTGMRLIEPDGAVHVGADAVYQITRRLRGFKRLAWLYRVPLLHHVFRAAYAYVARNRYKFARKCEDGVCTLDQNQP